MSVERDDYDELWSGDRWTCKIGCAGGHRDRVIDRLTVDDDGEAVLYLSSRPAGEHLDASRDRSTFAHDLRVGGDGEPELWYGHHVLRCPSCSVEVRLTTERLGALARGLREADRQHLDLGHLAAILSKQ